MSSKHPSGRSGLNWIEFQGNVVCRIIEFGQPDEDGVIIQRHEASASKDVICVLKEPANEYDIMHEEIAGIARTLFLHDGVYISVKPWPGARGDLLRHGLQVGLDILPVGAGCLDENGYVWDYRLLYLYSDIPTNKKDQYNPI